MRIAPPLLGLFLVLAAACGGSSDYEIVGDQAYASQEFSKALVEYQKALSLDDDNARLLRKSAWTALHTGELAQAADYFIRLADNDDEALEISADGLERVARAAVGDGNQAALVTALEGLQQISFGRAHGEFASELLSLVDDPTSSEVLGILPYAAAAAPDARTQDSIMYDYGLAFLRLERCGDAAKVLEGVARRGRYSDREADARTTSALCNLELGRAELRRGNQRAAADLFDRAADIGGAGSAGRTASLELGNVRYSLGEWEGAREAFLRVIETARTSDDDLAEAAREGLEKLRRGGMSS
ncbi:MAG: tetratricopeptide repeat protein [Gemmatimonadota bacterium]|nr:tetratricopeptide repeat protein [Gemmatimonadota bacterium]